MNPSLKKILLIGVALEMLLLIVSYLLHPSLEDTFRYAARYSGRLSLIVFLYAFYLFAMAHPKSIKENQQLRNYISLFAVLHLIHFGFLAMSVYLNAIPLETIKVIGGALAYLMIIVAPFVLYKISFRLQLVYFYYVSLVMALTLVARIKGDFEGAEPFWLHYLGLGVIVLCCMLFGIRMYKSSKE